MADTMPPTDTPRLAPGLWLARHAQPVVPAPPAPSPAPTSRTSPTSPSAPHSPHSPSAPAFAHARLLPARPASAHCYGHTDWPADPLLTQQAAQGLAQALATSHPLPTKGVAGAAPPVTVRCSPLKRCRQLAEKLAALRPDVTVVHDPRLAELHFGHWEGLPWDDVPRAELDAWAGNFGAFRVGTQGETVHELLTRVAQVAQVAQESAHTDAPDAVWITHAGVIRAMHWLKQRHWPRQPGVPQSGSWPVHAPEVGTWCHMPWGA